MRTTWALGALLLSAACLTEASSPHGHYRRNAAGSRRYHNPAKLPQSPFLSGAKPLHTYQHTDASLSDASAIHETIMSQVEASPASQDPSRLAEGSAQADLGADAEAHTGWVFLIRHGEKLRGGKPGLSADGKRRAKCIRRIFSRGELKADYALAQAYKKHGRRRRAYETLKPLAKRTGIPLDTSCQRDDPVCVRKVIARETAKGHNVVVSWEHAALTPIARQLGVKGLYWDESRFDMIFHIRGGKVHRIDSEECDGLDEKWMHWRGKKSKSGHGKGGYHGLLVDDESWAPGAGELLTDEPEPSAAPSSQQSPPAPDNDDEADDAGDDSGADDYDDLEPDEDDEPNDL